MRESKILVTGGTGLVGSYLIRYLAQQGHTQIRATCRPHSTFELLGSAQNMVEWVTADLQDFSALEEAMTGISQLYHCAAFIDFNQVEKLHKINAQGTANMVNAALKCGVKRMIYVSSIATTASDPTGHAINEENYFNPNEDHSPYAVSKFLAEQEVWRGFAEGLSGAIVNPGIILGGGFWDKGSLQILNIINQKIPLVPLGGTGFVDVRDVVSFMIALMNSEVQDERYLLVGANWKYCDLFAKLAELSRSKFKPIMIGSWMIKIGKILLPIIRFFSKNKNLIAPSTLKRTSQMITFDNRKSKSIFNFQYRPMDSTLKEIAEAIQKSRKNQEHFGLLDL